MIKDELAKLRKLVKGVERGEGSFETIYKKLDRIEQILLEDSEEDEEEFTPTQYIKPIQGLLDTYQKSLEKLKQQNRKLLAGQQCLRENNPNTNEQIQPCQQQPSSRKAAITTISPTNPSTRNTNGQRSASSTQAKSIKELDEEILHLTNEIRNTLR